MPSTRRIAENLARVRGTIAEAAARSGRDPSEVTLVAVTKYVGVEEAAALVEAGCQDLGESRPQELWDKSERLAGPGIRWHLVGQVQRNKVRRTLACRPVIHSVDSLRLLAALDEESMRAGIETAVLLEVNISGDAAKHGFPAREVESALEKAAACKGVAIRGLMGMAGLESGRGGARREFAALRELRDRLRANCPPAASLDELSMGMSGDYDIAVEEGATFVRVGSALFEHYE